jgi:hypothetical protein
MPYVPPKKKSFNILYDQAKYTGMLTKPSKWPLSWCGGLFVRRFKKVGRVQVKFLNGL